MSQYELIDIVDENDNFIKTIERTPEWNKTRPGTCRLVNVFVWNSKGELLIQQRSRTKSMGALKFDPSVGGLVTSGLSYEEAAKKEMQEELGLTGDLEFITAYKYTCPKSGEVRGWHNLFEFHSDGPYTNWEDEAERLEFMKIDEVKILIKRFPYLFTVGFHEAFKNYLEVKK